MTRDTAKFFTGVASMKIAQNSSSNGVYGFSYNLAVAKPAYTYTFRMKYLPNSTTARDNLAINIVWKDGLGATVSTDANTITPPVDGSGVPIPIDGTTWVDVNVQAVCPAGATNATFQVNSGIAGVATAGTIAWFDDVTLTTPPRLKVGLFGFDNADNIIDWDFVDAATTPSKMHAIPVDYADLATLSSNQYMMVANNQEMQIATTGGSATTADWITVTGYVRGRGGSGTSGLFGKQGESIDPYAPSSLNQSVRYLVPYVEWDIAAGSIAQLDQFSIEAYENGAPTKVATKDVAGEKAVSVENVTGALFDHSIRFYTGESDEIYPGIIGHIMDGEWNDAAHLRISPPLINANSDYGNTYIGIWDRNPNYIYDATFADGITGWAGMANTTLSHETSSGREDTNSLKITAVGTISSPATTELYGKYSVSTLANQELIGQFVVVSGYAMMGTATGRNVRIVMNFLNEAGSLLNTYYVEKAVTNTGWVDYSLTSSIVVPDTCYTIELSFSWFNGATGDIVLVDDVQLEATEQTSFRTASASRIEFQADVTRSRGSIIVSSSELALPPNVIGDTNKADVPSYASLILQSEGGTTAVRMFNTTDSYGNRASSNMAFFSPTGTEESSVRIYGLNDERFPGQAVLTSPNSNFSIGTQPAASGDLTARYDTRVYGSLYVDGDLSWRRPTLTNITEYDTNRAIGYAKFAGIVFLRGAGNGLGALGSTLFTLPTGYRPPSNYYLNAVTWTSTTQAEVAVLQVGSDGTVVLYSCSSLKTNLSFEGLFFNVNAITTTTPPSGDTTAPSTPSGFSITPLSSSSSTGTYRLNWANPSASDTAGVKVIWRSDRYPTVTIAGSGTKTLTTDGKIITVTGAASAAKQYDHSGLPVNKTIYYRVVSYDSSGNHSTYVSASRYLLASPISVTANSSDSYRLGYGGMWRNDGDDIYQGEWSGSDNHRGAYFYGTKIYDALNAGGVVRTPTKATIYLKRLSTSHGNNTGVGINLRGHVYQTKPSGDPVGGMTNEGSDGDDIVFLSRGEAATVTIPSSWYNNIVDSTASDRIEGFGVYGSSTSDYAVMYGVSSGSSYGKVTLYHKG
jgi:hypothetical protein